MGRKGRRAYRVEQREIMGCEWIGERKRGEKKRDEVRRNKRETE